MAVIRLKSFSTIVALFALLLALLISGFSSSCTRAPDSPEQKSRALKAEAGKMVFAFVPEDVREFVILKKDPLTHEYWSVTLSRSLAPTPGSRWKITSAPQGKPLIDSLANETLINHVISTFQTLNVSEFAPPGSLDQMGLASPHYTLKWSTSNATYQIEFGAPVGYGSAQGDSSVSGKRYALASVDASATAEFSQSQKEKTKPLIIQGATLQMLSYVTDFTSIRERRLAPYESDQFDAIRTSNAQAIFAAERNGDEWLQRSSRKKIKAPIQDWLQSLTHLRVSEFIDEESEAVRIQKKLTRTKPLQTITLEPIGLEKIERHRDPVRITLYEDSKQIYAEISSRKHATLPTLFKLFPESRAHLYAPPHKDPNAPTK